MHVYIASRLELADVVKHFSAKYGKDFVSAAVGLQTDSCVSRLLVDKLSVKAPDGPTKNKILKEIATEHNVTWEPESLVEPDPKETVLMSGASSSQSVSGINSYSSRIQTMNLKSFKLHLLLTWSRTFMKLAEYLPAALLLLITIVKIQDLLIRMVAESTYPHPGYVDSSPYETKFSDATTAAHAADESAERVSFAARAAAELSSKERMRMTMQSSTEEEEDQSTTRAELSKKNVDEQSENASWKRGHSRDNSLEMRQSDSFAKVGRAKQQPIKDDVNDSCSEDVQLKKQSSLASSSSHTSYVSDDNNIIFEDKRFQSTVEDTERKSHGHDVAPVMVTADKIEDKSRGRGNEGRIGGGETLVGEGEKAEKGNFERLEGSEVSVSLMDLLWGASSKAKGLKMVRAGGDKGDGLFKEDFGLKGMVLRSGLEEMVTKGTESEGSGGLDVEGRNGSGEIAGWEVDGREGDRIS
ncbi:hypothetical protein YC2023_118558 [Brassica napus]